MRLTEYIDYLNNGNKNKKRYLILDNSSDTDITEKKILKKFLEKLNK